MSATTTLVATLTRPPEDDGAALRAVAETVGVLEVRADLVGDLDPAWLRARFPGRLLYTLRSRAEGGAFEGGRTPRTKRLVAAAPGYDLVDLEADRDLGRDVLAAVPEEKRLLSWHGPGTHLTGLKGRFESMAATPARYYKLVPHALQSGDGLRVLQLLEALGREDVAAFATGPIGTWTRLVAPRLGCPFVYGSLGDEPAAPGQLSIAKLIGDYGLPALPPAEALYGIVGRPVLHSLSPRLHNAAYRAFGFAGLYVPFHVESFGDFWIEVVEDGGLGSFDLPLKGLSVTAPFKEVALAVSGASSPRAQHVGAANTLVLAGAVWEAETTDPEGVTSALDRHGVAMRGRRAAVVGCGGAGKAAAYGLEIAGAKVTLVNRSVERAKTAGVELNLPFVALADFDPSAFDLVVHATALGHEATDPLPFDVDRLRPDAVVVEMIYGAEPTPLERRARERGVEVVSGREVLLEQARAQVHVMTGSVLPDDLAREALGLPPAGERPGEGR